MGTDDAIEWIADNYDLYISDSKKDPRRPFSRWGRRIATTAAGIGCSPYDLARLADDYPDVFEEYVALFSRGGESFRKRRERTRASRVMRMFRGGGHRGIRA